MWQHIVKTHRIKTKVVVADMYSLAAFKAALVFIPIIVMPIVASLNIISVAVAAADAVADLRWCLRWCRR
jgi:hypothetical protein